MKAVFDTRGASTHQLKMLADWARSISTGANEGNFDVIEFIEIDLQKIFPDLGIFIEPDNEMGASRAFISDAPLGIVVSESIYEGACSGDLFSTEVILHEVGHLFLHGKYSPLSLNSAPAYSNRIHGMSVANNAEWQATTFAMCFLYPFPGEADKRTANYVQIRYRATRRQAERVAQHFERLRIRDTHRNLQRDRKWLGDVINSLPKYGLQESYRTGDQLTLFYQYSSNASVA
jgi:hypothetical protein